MLQIEIVQCEVDLELIKEREESLRQLEVHCRDSCILSRILSVLFSNYTCIIFRLAVRMPSVLTDYLERGTF